MKLPTTSSQTVGPFLHIGLTWLNTANLVGPGVSAPPITIAGRIVDGDAAPVSDSLVEIWQANEHGRYAHPDDSRDLPLTPNFTGFGRMPTDAEGRLQAPHVNVTLLMRGMLRQLNTRIYFWDEGEANAGDPVLQALPAARRETLVATRGDAPHAYVFDIVLQGGRETVFFDV